MSQDGYSVYTHYTPGLYRPEVYAPEIYMPGLYTPGVYALEIYIPGIYAPEIYMPGVYAPGVYSAGNPHARDLLVGSLFLIRTSCGKCFSLLCCLVRVGGHGHPKVG